MSMSFFLSRRALKPAAHSGMTGGFGADTFVSSSPNEGIKTITDFVSGSSTAAGDNLEFTVAGFGAQLTAGGAAPLVTASHLFSASNRRCPTAVNLIIH
jgi:Ca2+-binding RTX toxin-like protein